MEMTFMRRRSRFLKCVTATLALAAAGLSLSGLAVEEQKPQQVLFTNVNVFDGKSDSLNEGVDVLVEGNLIKAVGKSAKAVKGAQVIDGNGRTLMPGLIDNHVHLSLTGATLSIIENDMTWEDIAYNAVPVAEMYLMEGFTTVRDAGGTNAGVFSNPEMSLKGGCVKPLS